MKITQLTYPQSKENYLKQLLQIDDKIILKMGTCFFKAGTRIPETGLKANAEHEISIIMQGSIKVITHEQEKIVSVGDIIQFSPNEMQGGEIIDDCKILWVLLG